ncbi:unnamed protein product [Amoebophrya sp. A120]|nr:unnamed protein product [Amoebophrya sp. A120]|eukprot:GSA120T00000899001.1
MRRLRPVFPSLVLLWSARFLSLPYQHAGPVTEAAQLHAPAGKNKSSTSADKGAPVTAGADKGAPVTAGDKNDEDDSGSTTRTSVVADGIKIVQNEAAADTEAAKQQESEADLYSEFFKQLGAYVSQRNIAFATKLRTARPQQFFDKAIWERKFWEQGRRGRVCKEDELHDGKRYALLCHLPWELDEHESMFAIEVEQHQDPGLHQKLSKSVSCSRTTREGEKTRCRGSSPRIAEQGCQAGIPEAGDHGTDGDGAVRSDDDFSLPWSRRRVTSDQKNVRNSCTACILCGDGCVVRASTGRDHGRAGEQGRSGEIIAKKVSSNYTSTSDSSDSEVDYSPTSSSTAEADAAASSDSSDSINLHDNFHNTAWISPKTHTSSPSSPLSWHSLASLRSLLHCCGGEQEAQNATGFYSSSNLYGSSSAAYIKYNHVLHPRSWPKNTTSQEQDVEYVLTCGGTTSSPEHEVDPLVYQGVDKGLAWPKSPRMGTSNGSSSRAKSVDDSSSRTSSSSTSSSTDKNSSTEQIDEVAEQMSRKKVVTITFFRSYGTAAGPTSGTNGPSSDELFRIALQHYVPEQWLAQLRTASRLVLVSNHVNNGQTVRLLAGLLLTAARTTTTKDVLDQKQQLKLFNALSQLDGEQGGEQAVKIGTADEMPNNREDLVDETQRTSTPVLDEVILPLKVKRTRQQVTNNKFHEDEVTSKKFPRIARETSSASSAASTSIGSEGTQHGISSSSRFTSVEDFSDAFAGQERSSRGGTLLPPVFSHLAAAAVASSNSSARTSGEAPGIGSALPSSPTATTSLEATPYYNSNQEDPLHNALANQKNVRRRVYDRVVRSMPTTFARQNALLQLEAVLGLRFVLRLDETEFIWTSGAALDGRRRLGLKEYLSGSSTRRALQDLHPRRSCYSCYNCCAAVDAGRSRRYRSSCVFPCNSSRRTSSPVVKQLAAAFANCYRQSCNDTESYEACSDEDDECGSRIGSDDDDDEGDTSSFSSCAQEPAPDSLELWSNEEYTAYEESDKIVNIIFHADRVW